MPRIKIGILLSFAFFLALSGCGNSKNINDLLAYFKSQGLSIEEPAALTVEEKETVEGVKTMFSAMGIKGAKKHPVERKKKVVGGIKVEIYRFANKALAQEAYDNFIDFEERRKKRAHEKSSPYFKTSYYLNAQFLLQLRHYKARLVPGGLGADKIAIDESVLFKIKNTFEDFK